MNKKRKTLFIALLSIFTTAGVLGACKTVLNITEVPKDKDYDYQNPDKTAYAKPDEGFVIDGKADEAAYKNSTWVNLSNKNGNDTVELSMTSYFGEKGMYFIYDVTESTPIYVNHDRASYINSGIEMYLAPKGVTNMSNDHVYEIDLEADGTLTFKKIAGIGGSWINVGTTNDIMAQLASQPKGGEINSGDCYGYTLEFFIPWDYVEWLGMNPETMKEEYVSVNPVHITSYNYEGKVYETDRYWYSFATQLGGDGWGNVDQYFRFDKNGVVGTVPVTLQSGNHCTVSGPAAAVAGLPVKVTVTPDEGYAVSSFKCNGEECVKLISYNEDGSATYTVTAGGGMTFSAEAEAVTAGNKNLTGSITLKKAGGDTLEGITASYFDASGEHELPLDANGAFALNNLAQGYYTLSVEKKGYGKVSHGIYLNRNIDTEIILEYGMFDNVEGSCWDISTANEGYLIKKSGRGAVLSKDSYDTFYVEANFRYDADLAALSNADEYYQQRMGFRMKFSGGKYWHPDVMCEGGTFKVTYGKIMGNDSIFNWDTVHVMNARQIAQYKSEEGITLGILRVGALAYVYLDGELIATTDLGAQGIKENERAQIGFEGYVYNSENWTVNYSLEEKNADVVSLGEVDATGANVALDSTYKVGDNVIIVLDKHNATDMLLSLIVNGEEMSGNVIPEDDVDVLTISRNTARTLNIEAVYGEATEITANIAVDPAWNANGITFTFINVADPSIVKTATVVNDKMTIENMLQGRYTARVNVFGAELDLGSFSIVSEEEKLLEVEKAFINGKELDPSVMDLSTGSFLYHSAIDEDYSIAINKQGDAYLAAKLSLSEADKAKLIAGGEVSFGMYMTVEDDNGRASTHFVDFWIKRVGSEDWLTLRTDFGWSEDFCKPFSTNVNSNKYSNALFGDGLYVVLRYNSSKGVMETYFGANDFDVAYLRDWNDANNLFPVGGTVTQIGFRDSLSWGGTSVTVEVEGFRYGTTLLEALGVAGKDIVLDVEGEGGNVSFGGNYKAGETVTLSIAPVEGKILKRVNVNGVDMTDLVATDGTLTIQNCTAAALNVVAQFIDVQYAESFEVSINGRKYGIDGNAAEGKTVTLKRGDITATGTVTEGKVTFEHVAIADRYTLTVEGFVPLTDLTVTANGLEGIDNAVTVEYDAFYAGSHNGSDWSGYYGDPSKVDKTHVNDVEPYFTVNGTDFYQYSNDEYGNVIASITVNASMTDYNPTLGFVFEGHKAVMVRIERQDNGAKYKVQWIGGSNWEESCINGNWDFGEGEAFYNPISNELKQKYETEGLTLTLVRKGSTVCAYVDGVFVASQTIEGYADQTCSVFFAIAGVKGEQNIPFSITDRLPSVSIADQTAADANGTVEVSQTATLGETVTVTLTPNTDYKVSALLINGVDVTKDVKDNVYSFVAVGNAEIKATFEEIVKADINVSVVGKKLGVSGNAAEGLKATLTDGTFSYEGTVTDGSVAFSNVAVGSNYTLSIAGFIPVTGLTVTEDGIAEAITLEYDTFALVQGWGTIDLAKQNEATAEITVTNAMEAALTKDYYGDVAITLYLSGENASGVNQGVAFFFEGGGYVVLRMEGRMKIQFAEPDWNMKGSKADGAGWKDLIFLGENKDGGVIDENAETYLSEYANGTLKLTLVRKGTTFYAFLDDRYIGEQTVDAKYANVGAQVGFNWYDGANQNISRTFKFEINEGLPNVTVTDETAENANGTITGIPADPAFGESIELTITADEGYKLSLLEVNGVDVTANIVNGTYTFTLTGATTVKAEFEEIKPIESLTISVTGKKLGVSGNAAEGLKATLSDGTLSYDGTVTDGSVTFSNVAVGSNYTLSIPGFFSQTGIVVGEDGIVEAIALEYDLLENLPLAWGWGDCSDLSQQNDGKITHTNAATQWVSSKDTYQSVAITATVVTGGFRQGVFIRFAGDSYASDKYMMIQKESEQKISWNGESNIWGNGSNLCGDWTTYVSAIEKDVYELTLVRDGNRIHVFIDGVYCDTKVLDASYADLECCVGIYCTDANSIIGKERTFRIEDASVYLKDFTITDQTAEDANGTITGIPADPVLGDSVEITITADEGYKVSLLEVNGVDVTANIVNGTYTFTLTGDMTVRAEFEEIKPIESLTISVTGKKFGVSGNAAEGLKATLSDGTLSYDGTVMDGSVTFSNVAVGSNYTLSIAGFFSQTGIVVGEDGIVEAVTLEYDSFALVAGWGSIELSKQNETPAEITVTNEMETVLTKDYYGDVAITLYLSGENASGVNQGVVFFFEGGGYVILRMEGLKKIQFAEPDWYLNANKADGAGWKDLIFLGENTDGGVIDENAETYLSEYANGTLKLTLVRRGATFYAFLGDRYIGEQTVNAKYANVGAKVGFNVYTSGNMSRTFKFEMNDVNEVLPSVTVTDETAEDANGSVALSVTEGKMGDTVEITVTPDEGYKVATLTINGADVTAKLVNGAYAFAVTGDATVEATFEEIVTGTVNAVISGKKLGVSGNALTAGTVVTLSAAGLDDVAATLIAGEDGAILLSIDEITAGIWTLSVKGYHTVEIEVVKNQEYGQPIALEYDTFVPRQNWGTFDYTYANDENAKIIASNGGEMITTKDVYGDVMFSLYLGGENRQGGNQAIYFLFGTEIVSVRMEGTQKIQFSMDPEWVVNAWRDDQYTIASGSTWKDLIFFTEGDDYLNAYAAGTLKLSVLRRANTFYVFLDGKYIGEHTFDAKYATAEASVGICFCNLTDNVNKEWGIELKTDIPEVDVENVTADANGTVEGIPATAKLGDAVELTLTPNSGYILKSLTVGGKDVTGSVKFDKTTQVGTYAFTVISNVEISAEFEEAVYGGMDAAISGTKYGTEGAVDLNNTVVTLSNTMAEYKITVAEGKLALQNVLAGTYTLTAAGYLPVTVEIADGETYVEAIALVYNIFTSAPASADLSGISQGKVIATGNGGVDLATSEKYSDVIAEAKFDIPDYNSRRYGVSLVFDDGKNFRIDFCVQDGGNNILQETNWSSMMFNWDWVDFPEGYFASGTNSYTEAEIRDVFMVQGLTYKLEREGATIKIYINGVLMNTYTLPEEYATQSAAIRFIADSDGTDGTKGFTFTITVPEEEQA